MKYLQEACPANFEIQQMTILAFETRSEIDSKIIQDLCGYKEPEELCELFGWKKSEPIIQELVSAFESKEISYFLTQRADMHGILAQVRIPILSNFRLKDNGEIRSYQASFGLCHLDWVWADSLGEFAHKMNLLEEKWKSIDLEDWKSTKKA